jgi:alpha-L-arabinofuranosidase
MKWQLPLVSSVVIVACLIGRSPAAETAKTPAGPITIDAGKTREPMSKYIYGQFIEHLGRCIYGGIWAEMLEDRKFFEAVGARTSPWKPLGGEDRVAMDKNHAFVGEHTPVIAAPGGLVQGDLALQKGRKYVGRIWLAGDAATGTVTISLVWGEGANDRATITVGALTGHDAKTALAFTAGADCDHGRLEIQAAGKGSLRVGTVSLMPADNVHGMRADTLALLKQLDSPVYRWPGGNFVSGYHWKDGIGDPDRRPPRKNPAWKGIEHNDFGIDEFMVYCRTLGTEPYIAVNSGLGDAKEAVAEVEYANGSAKTAGGALRAKLGHPHPYGVKWWSVGNEMYGNWQLGHMPLSKYVEKHNQFAEAMKAVDPAVQLIAVGDAGPWSENMLRHCADHMNLMSEHFYTHEKKDVAAHVRQVPDAIRKKAVLHRQYRQQIDSLKGKDIRIAMDEWNYWYGPDLYGQIGTRYFLKDALGIAAGLNEYSRQSDIVFMANYAQTVNVIGCIKTTKTEAAFDTTGQVLVLYRQHFGTLPVAAQADAPLDVAAAFTTDRKTLTIAVVNPTPEKLELPLKVAGAALADGGRRWQLTGDGPMAYNEPGKKPGVTVKESAVDGSADKLSLAPFSVTLYAFAVK